MRINILGVGFDNITKEEAVSEALALLDSGGTHYVVTPNPEIVEVCREQEEVAWAVNGADLVLPDGTGVIKGAKLLGTPLRERVPGIEFAADLLARLAQTGHTLYLLAANRESRRRPQPILCGRTRACVASVSATAISATMSRSRRKFSVAARMWSLSAWAPRNRNYGC